MDEGEAESGGREAEGKACRTEAPRYPSLPVGDSAQTSARPPERGAGEARKEAGHSTKEKT